MMARNLTPAERDALLERLVDGMLDAADRIGVIESRLGAIERATGAGAMAIIRESTATILADRIKTSAFFAFLTVCVVVGGAIYLDSEAALVAVATGTGTEHTPAPIPAPHEEAP